ncbi:MAG: hypothetical protein K6C34_03805 [Alphaproteobacteria bacterium]|nr:hypothetical protein [Alphaproteobacteria bacterium]
MRQFIIELSKLEATPKRFLNDMFSIWMMFIRDPNSIPPEFLAIDEVKEAMDELTVMSSDPMTRAEYLARQRELNDIRSGMSVKYEEGIEKGKAEGAQQKAIETAKKMLNDGLSADLVAKYSGLSIAEIEGLLKS